MRNLFSRWRKEQSKPEPEQPVTEPEQLDQPRPADITESVEPNASIQEDEQHEEEQVEVQDSILDGIEAVPEPGEQQVEAAKGPGFFQRLVRGLAKTRAGFVTRVTQVLTGRSVIDAELYNELEEALIQADVGVSTSTKLVEAVKKRVASEHITDPQDVVGALRAEMARLLESPAQPLAKPSQESLTVFLVVGVNGVGKTTLIGKLAARFKAAGLRVVLGAADTFRAAAIDQLEAWGQRAGVDVIKHQEGSDPAAVAFDAVQAARARKANVLIIDTAGRLQVKQHLMLELAKINRVVERELGRKPDEVLLVIDSTTGQNGISQARLFSEATPVTGVALTKLDGTAKGGIVLSIAADMQLPVKLIGLGEGIDDLRDFDPTAFVSALFTLPEAAAQNNPS